MDKLKRLKEITDEVFEVNAKLTEENENLTAENGKLKDENRWIPLDEELPEPDKYILLSIENFTMPLIGRYEVDDDEGGSFYEGDESTTLSEQGLFVNAWRLLPEPYKEEE